MEIVGPIFLLPLSCWVRIGIGFFYSNVGQMSFCNVYISDLFLIDPNAQFFLNPILEVYSHSTRVPTSSYVDEVVFFTWYLVECLYFEEHKLCTRTHCYRSIVFNDINKFIRIFAILMGCLDIFI